MLQDKLLLEFASDELKDKIKIIEKSSIPKLQCGYCEKFYKSRSSKSVHIKSCKLEHQEIILVNNRDICHYCNIKFNCLTSAYNHKKICKQKQKYLTTKINNINNNSNNNNSINNSNNITNNSSNDNITNNSSVNITNITQNFIFKDTK